MEDLFKDELDDAPGADIMERKPVNLDCPSVPWCQKLFGAFGNVDGLEGRDICTRIPQQNRDLNVKFSLIRLELHEESDEDELDFEAISIDKV